MRGSPGMNRLFGKIGVHGSVSLIAMLVLALPVVAEEPGYQGFGAKTKGGEGGTTVTVTTLADSGPGSLRDALAGGNRRIVFKVGGTIKLASPLHVKPNVTIDGSTAPAPGITLAGQALGIVDTHDVIVNNLRFRGGLNSNMRIMGATR